jgi:hypothetical protein
MEQDHEAEAKRREQSAGTRGAAKPDETGKSARKHIDPERLYKAIRFLKAHPEQQVRQYQPRISDHGHHTVRCLLGHNLSLVVDCPSNRLDGRLTFQKGFNRAFSLSAFMSSSSRQRPYPSPPLLPQLAESTFKVSQMLVLNHFHVLSSLSDIRRALAALHQPICHVIRRFGLIGSHHLRGRNQGRICWAISVVDQTRPSEAHLHHFASVARGTREVPLMAAHFAVMRAGSLRPTRSPRARDRLDDERVLARASSPRREVQVNAAWSCYSNV